MITLLHTEIGIIFVACYQVFTSASVSYNFAICLWKELVSFLPSVKLSLPSLFMCHFLCLRWNKMRLLAVCYSANLILKLQFSKSPPVYYTYH